MRGLVKKRWFLMLLAIGLTLAAVWPDTLEPVTRVIPPLAIVAPALFLMALGLDSRSLYEAVLRPWPALWAVAISYGFVPSLGWFAGHTLLAPEFAVGLMISASVPCTLASAALWTRMAGGREATALLVTLLTTSTSWLATTAWLKLGTGTQVHVDTATMMVDLLKALVVPVGLGQMCRLIGLLARTATAHKKALGVVSQLLIFVIILKAAVDVRLKMGSESTGLGAGLVTVALVCVGTHLTALAAGWWSSKGFGFDRPNQIAVAFACSQKTLPVALYLFEAHFQATPLAIVPLVLYHVGQLTVDTFIADRLVDKPAVSTDVASEAGA
jgi:sodium/bile acid cotransporter 7